MRRRAIVFAAVGLALVVGLLPLAIMSFVSQERAVAAERAHLDEYARWTLARADLTLSEAKLALQQVEADGLKGCTKAHITRMRQVTVDNRFIEEMGYYDGARLGCTSWGMVEGRKISRGAPRQVLPGGYGLFIGVRPKISRAHSMIVLSYGDHNVLINPQRMTDVLVDTHMTLGVATADGKLIALSGAVPPDLVTRLSGQTMAGMDDQHVFASARGQGGADGLVAFAVSDRAAIKGRFDREILMFAPLALLASGILVAIVVLISRQRLSPQAELDEAIRNRAFTVHYQPIIDLATGRCVGAEALARWRRPEGDWAAPDEFIPLAERSGLIGPLTDVLIQRVVRDIDAMLDGEPDVHIAINLSASDIESGRFLPVLAQALAESNVTPSQIWLEATERGFINAEAARRTIDKARAAGYLVAIDDFGTGYSSLSMLENLPLDALKIDKSFIAAIGRDSATSVVTPHIIDMAHGLHFDIVAEGVETREQEALVRAAGVQFAQGWLYSKALPPEDFAAFFDRRNRAAGVELALAV